MARMNGLVSSTAWGRDGAVLQACHRESLARIAELPNAHGREEPITTSSEKFLGTLDRVLGLWSSQHFHFHFFAGASQTRRRLPNPVARTHQRQHRSPVSRSRPDPAPAARNIIASTFLSRLPSPARVLELRNLTFSIHQHTRVALTQHLSKWLFPLSLISPSRPTT